LFAFERIAADELAEAVGFVRGRSFVRPHLIEHDARAGRSGLKSGLAAGQTGAYDMDRLQVLL
jgi:hypothetical protein